MTTSNTQQRLARTERRLELAVAQRDDLLIALDRLYRAIHTADSLRELRNGASVQVALAAINKAREEV